MTAPKLCGRALDGDVLLELALGVAGGQLEQAARWIAIAAHRLPPARDRRDSLTTALEHLRSAAGWLETAARQR